MAGHWTGLDWGTEFILGWTGGIAALCAILAAWFTVKRRVNNLWVFATAAAALINLMNLFILFFYGPVSKPMGR